MADNNKAYNLSVRDDTSFRVESGGSDITVRNIMSAPVVIRTYDANGTIIATDQILQNGDEIVITGDVKTVALRNQSV